MSTIEASTIEDCSICCIPPESQSDLRTIDGAPVCTDCVKQSVVPLFEAALTYESSYPAKWGSDPLDIDSVKDLLAGEDAVARYGNLAKEHAIQQNDRVYCGHLVDSRRAPLRGALARERLAVPVGYVDYCEKVGKDIRHITLVPCDAILDGSSGKLLLQCHRCLGLVCTRCKTAVDGAHDRKACWRRTRNDTADDRFEGMTRGKEYQLCPNPKCRAVVQLSDGCNHIICQAFSCRAEFCYICGERATHASGHWGSDKDCPRYNHPEADNAQYDNPGDYGGTAGLHWLALPPQMDEDREAADAALARVRAEIESNWSLVSVEGMTLAGLEYLVDRLLYSRDLLAESALAGDDLGEAELIYLTARFWVVFFQINEGIFSTIPEQASEEHLPLLDGWLEEWAEAAVTFLFPLCVRLGVATDGGLDGVWWLDRSSRPETLRLQAKARPKLLRQEVASHGHLVQGMSKRDLRRLAKLAHNGLEGMYSYHGSGVVGNESFLQRLVTKHGKRLRKAQGSLELCDIAKHMPLLGKVLMEHGYVAWRLMGALDFRLNPESDEETEGQAEGQADEAAEGEAE